MAATLALNPVRSGGAGAEPLPSPGTPGILDQLQTSSRQVGGTLPPKDGWCPELLQNWDSIPFQHKGWHTMRMRVLRAMRETQQTAGREWKFCDCGGASYVYENTSTGEVDVRGSRCEDRFCVPCGQKRSRQIADSLRVLIAKEPAMFITFTVRGLPHHTLAGQLEKLKNAWKDLRRLPLWKDSIRGGAIMLEVKWSTSGGGHWHPHYHLICHGKWIDQDRLRAAWFALTGDSDQVNVQRVAEVEKSLGYVTKYASKCVDSSFVMKPGKLREAMQALKGTRLCACFGSWFGTPLREEFEDEGPTEVLTPWLYCGTISDLEFHAAAGDAHAKDVLQRVERLRALRQSLTDRCTSPPEVRHAAPAADAAHA